MADFTTTTFVVGDRVRLKAPGTKKWFDYKLQRRAELGTPATIVHVVGSELRPNQRSYGIDFDRTGRMKPMSKIIPVQELERVETEARQGITSTLVLWPHQLLRTDARLVDQLISTPASASAVLWFEMVTGGLHDE